ncbi:unnamed protein product [Ilex paraguariensis]|uniref:Uncharacterized protein n=1 Tax=Ilex paraguariensis TaxID=185542 RepID=A0ABC8UAZ6_9AQUA
MDYMDIDHITDVPDTPDRLAGENISGGGCIQKETNLPVADHSEDMDISDEGDRGQLRGDNKLVMDNGSTRLSSCPSKHPYIFDNSKYHISSTVSAVGNPSSSKNGFLLRRSMADKTANHESAESIHWQQKERGKALLISQSSAYQHKAVVDLTEKKGHAQEFEEAFRSGAVGNSQAEELTATAWAKGFSSLQSMENGSATSTNGYKGKEKVDVCKVGSSFGRGKGIDIVDASQPRAGKRSSALVHSITFPRVIRQKKLVRNGCISPHNIAKAKHVAAKHGNVNVGQKTTGCMESNCPPNLINLRDLITEDNNSQGDTGKGVTNHPFLLKDPEVKTMHLSSRSSTNFNEKANVTSNASGDTVRCFEGLSGINNTDNRLKNLRFSSSDEDQHIFRGKGEPCVVLQQDENGVVRRDIGNGSSARTDNEYPKNLDLISCQHGIAPVVSQRLSYVRPQLLQSDEASLSENTTVRRERPGSISRNHGECSTSAFDDSEIVFLGSSGESLNPRSVRNQSCHDLGILDPVINLDEFSPEVRHGSSHTMGCSSYNDSGARARQVEADELLARELQEQLYNEVPGVAVGEIDAHIALALQQVEDTQHAFSSGSHQIFHPVSGSCYM